MAIVGIDKLSLLDYEDKVSVVLFSQACNFRCPFCHNGDSVLNAQTELKTGLAKGTENIKFLKLHQSKVLNQINDTFPCLIL